MTREVQQLLKERITAIRTVDKALYSMTWTTLKREIKKAKRDYRRRIEEHRSGREFSILPTTGPVTERLKVTPHWQRS